ncbi:MAG: AbrB/MazE/SpoVT family DNA-binding domain-containing protein [Betaproteobacteria bacterium]|nr:AbrB/MazE/SpoVT family DNA-binding domain-containing protein [Betaproteobacteria bacterium]
MKSGRPPCFDTAKLFTIGRSRAVRLPEKYRFKGKLVYIRRDPVTGDVVISSRSTYWAGFFAARKAADVPADFLSKAERFQDDQIRDPLEGIDE